MLKRTHFGLKWHFGAKGPHMKSKYICLDFPNFRADLQFLYKKHQKTNNISYNLHNITDINLKIKTYRPPSIFQQQLLQTRCKKKYQLIRLTVTPQSI